MFPLLYALLTILVGYLAVFVIIYDFWSHHRMILTHTQRTRLNSAIGTFALFLCSIVPPIYYLINHMRLDFLLGVTQKIGTQAFAYEVVRGSMYVIIVGIYGSFALITALEIRARQRRDEALEVGSALEHLRTSSFAMIPMVALFYALSWTGYAPPPVPVPLIAICTYLPLDRLLRRPGEPA